MVSPDVLIVGGGPAGAAAAIDLARAGREVVLLERLRGAAHKVCGEFLSGEALGSLDRLGVDTGMLGAPPITRMRLVAREPIAEAPLPFPARAVTRRVLDEALLACAAAAGVRVLRGSQAEELQRSAAGWRVSLADGTRLAAPHIFLATGKHDLRGHPRGRGLQNSQVAFKMYFRLDEASRRELGDAVELILFAGGYAGLQAVENGCANLGLVIDGARLRRTAPGWPAIQAHLERSSSFLARRLAGAQTLLERPLALSGIPYGFLRREADAGLWWLGDQAAVIPSFSGDGMSIAFHSAALAAQMYLDGAGSSRYQRTLAASLRGQVLLATAVSQLLVRLPRAAGLARAWPGVLSRLALATRIQGQRHEAV